MPALPELQRAFAKAVFAEDAIEIHRAIRAGRFAPERYLQIYRHNIFASLSQAMKDVYPVVTRLVGEGFMDYATDQFIRRHAPHSGNLHDFGSEFSAFLREFPPAHELTYLPDVARLEWAYHVAFHAADAQAHAAEHLRAMDPAHYGTLRFMLHPSAQLIASDYPILRIWEANQPDVDGEDRIDLDDGGVDVLVIRRRTTVELQSLSPGEHAMLSAMARGEPFAQACEAALAAEADFALSQSFQTFALDGTIVDVQRPAA